MKHLPLFALIFAGLCTGCLSLDERQIAPELFDISTPASELINSGERARVILDLRAHELCPKGYMRISEDHTMDRTGVETMRWRVACAP